MITNTEEPAPMFLDPKETLVFVDIETFGLSLDSDPPIEIGFCVTDLDLHVLHVRKWLIWEEYYDIRKDELEDQMTEGDLNAKIVWEMHRDSFLWGEAMEDGSPRMDVEQDILDWFKLINLPRGVELVGSTVGPFDKPVLHFNLNLVDKYFHHRVLDISSLKVLMEKYAPEVAAGAKELKPKKLHRVLPDIEDTMAEFEFYLGKLVINGKKIWEED